MPKTAGINAKLEQRLKPGGQTKTPQPLAGPRRQISLEGRSGERMAQHDGLVAVRAGRNDVDRRADQVFDALDVGASSGWQLFQGLGTEGRLAPAWHLFVHWLQADVAVGIGRRIDHCTILVLVANTDVDGFQAVEYVQLGQADARDAVDVDGATQNDGIEPATTCLLYTSPSPRDS